jgi:WD domain, G-beta repeat
MRLVFVSVIWRALRHDADQLRRPRRNAWTFSPDAKWIVSGDDRTVKVWEMVSRSNFAEIRLGGTP